MNLPNRPLIGITTYAKNEQDEVTLPVDYVDAVRRAGGVPLLIAPGESHVSELLACIDGLILAGGGDIAPACYGGQEHPEVYMVDHDRDRTELQLAQMVIENQLPTLAICRGLQIVNVALGGTLHAHLPEIYGEGLAHRAPPRKPTPHPVQIEADSSLARVLETTQVQTMSWHHQAINQLGSTLRVTAAAPDGVVEAVELNRHRWLIGVQWHPELTAVNDVSQQNLFDEVVRQSKVARSTLDKHQ
ncbi:MAG: gamma-glutamyl-gamma-aminobutyrate hydrolase family protein [Pirellulaceae bacterium]|nr:gamma-glutamyl-gamma-aminobutyrate hydrolase family protein [Pirellulaceae bacterium]